MRRPDWIRATVRSGPCVDGFKRFLETDRVRTICREADCPNKWECWDSGNATFIILGDICSRDCLFCNVKKGVPFLPDPEEPQRVAEAVAKLEIKYAVITSVTRDDLPDAGAGHFKNTIEAIKRSCPCVPVEVLIPDLAPVEGVSLPGLPGAALEEIVSSSPEVVGHNVEMPEKLYPSLRKSSCYQASLRVLELLSALREGGAKILVKSSMMLGLGEAPEDILKTVRDLKRAGTDIVCLGQYLSPSVEHWSVKKYYTPEEFSMLRRRALDMGIREVVSGPMVRSSYRAHETYRSLSLPAV